MREVADGVERTAATVGDATVGTVTAPIERAARTVGDSLGEATAMVDPIRSPLAVDLPAALPQAFGAAIADAATGAATGGASPPAAPSAPVPGTGLSPAAVASAGGLSLIFLLTLATVVLLSGPRRGGRVLPASHGLRPLPFALLLERPG